MEIKFGFEDLYSKNFEKPLSRQDREFMVLKKKIQ